MGIRMMLTDMFVAGEGRVPNAIVLYNGPSHDDPQGDLFIKTGPMRSTHYVVERSGEIIQCVDDGDVALHAPPEAVLFGDREVNRLSLGVSLAHSYDDEAYCDDQIGSLISLVTALSYEYEIPLNRIVANTQLACGEEDSSWIGFPWFDFLLVIAARVSELQFTAEKGEAPPLPQDARFS